MKNEKCEMLKIQKKVGIQTQKSFVCRPINISSENLAKKNHWPALQFSDSKLAAR